MATSHNNTHPNPAHAPTPAPTPAATPAGFDAELDAFFKAAPPAPAPTNIVAASSTSAKAAVARPSNPKKRKATNQQVDVVLERDAHEQSEQEHVQDNDEHDDHVDDVDMEQADADLSSLDEDLDDQGSLLFSQSQDERSDNQEHADDDEPYVPPHHESLAKAHTAEPAKQRKKSFKEAPEPSETRDQRTLFIGNVPIHAAQSRSLQRKLVSFIESFSPYPVLTKATRLRFRSVAFSVPTLNLDADEDDEADSKKNNKGKPKERSQNYRQAVAAVQGADPAQAPLTAQQKRKIAFINKDFHQKAKSVSAYVTIAHPKAVLDHLYDISPPKPKSKNANAEPVQFDSRLTASVLAALIASFADGQAFEGRHLRVDLVKSISPSEVLSSGLEKVKTFDGTLAGSSSSTADPKTTLFVGGLDFEADEEQVRAFFEALLVEELGAAADSVTIPVTGLDGEPASKDLIDALSREFPFLQSEKRKLTESVVRNAEYVRSVRLIRDAATQMGKGIGYVSFVSQQCVDEVMAIYNADKAFLESVKRVKGSLGASAAIAQGGKEFKRRLKLRGRPIRVAYCKSHTKNSAPSRNPRSKKATDGEDVQEPSTPQRKPPRYERSSGAPTPNGTSPHVLGNKSARTGPTKIVPGSPTASRSSNPADIAKKAELYATLSKDQRKQMKKDDQDRVNRRLAKKSKKFGAAGGAKGKMDKSLLAEGEKAKSKEKVKLRQPSGASGAGKGAPPPGAKRFKPAGSAQGGARRGPPKSK